MAMNHPNLKKHNNMNRAKARLVFLLLAIVCLFSCKKNNETDNWNKDLKFQVDTINITETTALIKGTITLSSSQQYISEYGVDYDTVSSFAHQNETLTNTHSTSTKSVPFSITISGLRTNSAYYVRVWTLLNPNPTGTQGYYYGNAKNFKTLKFPIQITKLSPDSGTYHDQVTIIGKGFNRTGINNAMVNGVAAMVTAAYDDSLHVMVPKKCGTGIVTVSIGTENTSGPQFKYINEAYVVYTIAGGALSGLVNGVGTAARFNSPEGIAFDKNGNLLVADFLNSCIRKITPDMVVSTLAGSSIGQYGYIDGSSSAAEFWCPSGLTIDITTGNIFVVDSYNNCIRIVKGDGSDVKTFAGTDTLGYKDGWGIKARFAEPSGIAKDNRGNFYVTDKINNRIRKIDGFGQVTTFAGDGYNRLKAGIGTLASIGSPDAITFDGNKNFYVSGLYGQSIVKIDTIGQVSVFVGQGGGTSGNLGCVTGIRVDAQNNLFVTDQVNNCLEQITPSGQVSIFSGKPTESKIVNGGISKARFKKLWGMTIDDSGNLYVLDDNCIRKIEKVN
jgi:hypothetical protein